MKTAITIIADLVRSLVLGGLAVASAVLAVVLLCAMAGYGMWRLWRRARRRT
jgi:type IV secretory pathway VirB2 component (pilin)